MAYTVHGDELLKLLDELINDKGYVGLMVLGEGIKNQDLLRLNETVINMRTLSRRLLG
jgi:hypothetical protein